MVAGLRQRKKEKARNDLVRSALRLFNKQGFAATTVEEIAAAVDLSPRTFFRYFAAKEDVVFATAEEDLQGLVESLRVVPGRLSGFAALAAAVAGFAEELDARRDELQVRFRLVRANPSLQAKGREMVARWAGALAAELARREGRDGPAPAEELVALLAVSALWLALEEIGGELDAEPLSRRVSALFADCRAVLV
jgi:AcrR family transcriptional regulator